jgi:hypothetical protein
MIRSSLYNFFFILYCIGHILFFSKIIVVLDAGTHLDEGQVIRCDIKPESVKNV